MDRYIVRTKPIIFDDWHPVTPTLNDFSPHLQDDFLLSYIDTPYNYVCDSTLTSFFNYLPEACFQEIATGSNAHFYNEIRDKPKISKRNRAFKYLTGRDIMRYVGVLIMMGIDRKPEHKMHWKHEYWNGTWIRNSISYDDFISIGSWLGRRIRKRHQILRS